MATPTAPTPGDSRSPCSRGAAGGRSRRPCRASATADKLAPEPILPQLDKFAAAAVRYAAGRERTPVIAGRQLAGWMRDPAPRRASRWTARGRGRGCPGGLEMNRLLYSRPARPDPALTRALPSPVPAFVLRPAVARLYRRLASRRRLDRSRGDLRVHLSPSPALAGRALTWTPLIACCPSCAGLSSWRRSVYRSCWYGETMIGWCSRAVPSACSRQCRTRLEMLEGVGHCPQVEAAQPSLSCCAVRDEREAAAA